MPYPFKSIVKGALLSGALLVVPQAAHAASYKWVGPDNGAWNNPVNWAPQGVPGPADNVLITGKKKVAVPADATVANLTVGPGAEIKNGAQIKVTGKTSSSGLFTGLGTLNIPEGAIASFNVTPAITETTADSTTALRRWRKKAIQRRSLERPPWCSLPLTTRAGFMPKSRRGRASILLPFKIRAVPKLSPRAPSLSKTSRTPRLL